MSKTVDKDIIIKKLLEEVSENKISCPQARALAKELDITSEEIGKFCNQLKIKIYACELGCFK